MLPSCGLGWEMMDAMRRQQEHLMQLRALVLPMLHGVINGTSAAEIGVQLFDDVIGCNIGMVSTLEGCLISTRRAAGGSSVEPMDGTSLVRKRSCNVTNNGEKTEERSRSVVGQKRRRNDKRSRSVVTHVPHYDGYQWRKYGQKNVNGRRHPRSYYRCTYREQNCFATKTIEQQEQIDSTCSSTTGEEIPKYTVVYYGDHTCKDHSISTLQVPQPVSSTNLQNMEMAQTSSDVQDPETDLDLQALLEVFDNSLIDWEDSWKM